MKRVTIYKRTVMERTRFRDWRYKEDDQYSIESGKDVYTNCNVDRNNPKLRVKFEKVFETRNKKELEEYSQNLGRSENDYWQRSVLRDICPTATLEKPTKKQLKEMKKSQKKKGKK